MEFDWDEANREHVSVHGITCEEVEQLLRNDSVYSQTQFVPGEVRHLEIGETNRGQIWGIVYTMRGNRVRPITVLEANRIMKQFYLTQKGRLYGNKDSDS